MGQMAPHQCWIHQPKNERPRMCHCAWCHNLQHDCVLSKSSRTMTKLSEGECHNHTMKRVGCDPHVMTSKAASTKRHPSGHMRADIEECHDAIEENDASSHILPRKVGIEDKLRHKQDRDIRIDIKDKDRLVEGPGRALGLNIKSRGFKRNLGMRFGS